MDLQRNFPRAAVREQPLELVPVDVRELEHLALMPGVAKLMEALDAPIVLLCLGLLGCIDHC